MMKKLLFFILIFNQFFIYAQKEDAVWVMGYTGTKTGIVEDTLFGVTTCDFSKTNKVFKRDSTIHTRFFENNSSICDTFGSLLMVYNGYDIFNSLLKPMTNSDSLNKDLESEFPLQQNYIPQGGLILPLPNHKNQYVLLHEQAALWYSSVNMPEISGFQIFYSIIDMSEENGLGKVIERRKLLLRDTLDYGKMTAVRHANGRDWWIIVQEFNAPNYYKILLNPDGVKVADKQKIGIDNYSGLGQALFSPDGKTYVNMDADIGKKVFTTVFNFDRCTGLLSNPINIPYPIKQKAWSGGIAISPNSKYLYVSLYEHILQYDLSAMDIASTQYVIDTYDGFIDSTANTNTRFFLANLAADGKIYISTMSATRYLHVIHKPNEPKKKCTLEQHGLKLKTFNVNSVPNYPNFKLGKAENACITSDDDAVVEKVKVKIYPNPSADFIYLEYNKEKLTHSQLIVNDIQGRLMLKKNLNDDKIDVHNFLQGIYFLQISKEKKVVFREKIIVLKH